MTDARWQTTVEFLRSATWPRQAPTTAKAWTVDIVNNVRVLP